MMAPSGATARDSAGRQADLRAGGLHLHRQLVDHLDALDRAPHAGRGGGERVRAHLALEAELDVLGRELVAVVEGLAGPEMEGPGHAVGRELPAFGDAGADAAFCEVEADQRVVHDRLVDRVARPPFEDRIERLGAERFDGEDERALLVLGVKRHPGGENQGDSQSRDFRDVPEHEFLPNVDRFWFFRLSCRRSDYPSRFENLSIAPASLCDGLLRRPYLTAAGAPCSNSSKGCL